MATAGLADIRSCNWGRTEEDPRGATGWRVPPDPTDKPTTDKGHVVAPAQPHEQVSCSSMHEWPPVR